MAGSKRTRAAERQRKAQRRRLINRSAWVGGGLALVLLMVLIWPSTPAGVGVTDTDSWDLPALDGDDRITLEDFAGRPTVAAFFASWCDICQRELPGFADLALQLDHEVDFVGINTMNHGSGLSFARQSGIGDWPLARDIGLHDGRQLATNFGARGSPTTVIYDESGTVVDVTLGALTAQQLAAKLNQLFGIAP